MSSGVLVWESMSGHEIGIGLYRVDEMIMYIMCIEGGSKVTLHDLLCNDQEDFG